MTPADQGTSGALAGTGDLRPESRPEGPASRALFSGDAEGPKGPASPVDPSRVQGTYVTTEISEVPLLLMPHPKAPLFSRPDAPEAFAQIVGEVARGNFPATETFMRIFAQAGYANLYFYLRYIAAYSGAFEKLKRDLHADVCNAVMLSEIPGVKLAIVLPRSTFKSTCATVGGSAWKLNRNYNRRIGIFSFPADRAVTFFIQARSIFDSNDLHKELYPETIPALGRGVRWNDTEFVMPNRTRDYMEASLTPYTAGGATQGIHLDEADIDDIIGDSMLNADRGATADMLKMTHWFEDNQNTILQNPERSNLMVSLTRYSPADNGEEVMKHSYLHLGNWYNLEDRYPVDPMGTWITYYRSGRKEDGESLFPEQYSKEFLDKLQTTKPATYQLNYANDPFLAGTLDFAEYKLGVAELVEKGDELYVYFPNEQKAVPLASCSLIQALDPAAKEKFVSIKTSRTAHVVLAMTPSKRYVFLKAQAGFKKTTEWFDWLFSTKRRYGDTMGKSYAELVAGFKSLGDVVKAEQVRRGEWISFEGVNALGDKDTTIRNIWQPLLEKGLVYATEKAKIEIEKELALFPSGPYKDVLDAGKIALKMIRPPDEEKTEDEIEEEREALEVQQLGRSPTTGY